VRAAIRDAGALAECKTNCDGMGKLGGSKSRCRWIIAAAQQIANHESPRTTKLYDHTSDAISLDEIERIMI
jgi:hypothetical protein